MRPTTGPTSFPRRRGRHLAGPGERPVLDTARVERRICRESDPDWTSGVPVRARGHPGDPGRPGDRGHRAVDQPELGAHAEPPRADLPAGRRRPGADGGRGHVPLSRAPTRPWSARRGSATACSGSTRRAGSPTPARTRSPPTAGSASPRTWWAAELGAATAQLCASGEPVDESLMLVARGRAPRETEIDGNGSVVQLRSIPLVVGGQRTGALVLVRDVTELRRRERELLTKEATIREIHHRVKNNLQTVAALLRLQARRLQAPEARAALEEAVRRVGSIAIVHETLSHAPEEIVDFDDIADRVAMMAGEVSPPEVRVTPEDHRPVRHAARGGGDAAGAWCSPSCCRTRCSTGSAPRRRAGLDARDHRGGGGAGAGAAHRDGDRQRRRAAAGVRPGDHHEPGPADRPDAGGRGARRPAAASRPGRAAAPRRSSTCRSATSLCGRPDR